MGDPLHLTKIELNNLTTKPLKLIFKSSLHLNDISTLVSVFSWFFSWQGNVG